MDGSLGSRTAALLSALCRRPRQQRASALRPGPARCHDQRACRRRISDRLSRHWRPGSGDGSQRLRRHISPAMRDRIEHSQVVEPEDIPRYKALGVIASMQPSHLAYGHELGGGAARPATGHAYAYGGRRSWMPAYRWLSGTDYPVEPITPFRGIYAGVTRSNEAGTSSYFPARQADHWPGALRLYPRLRVCGVLRKLKGRLVPGYVADFIVLDRDLTPDSRARDSQDACPARRWSTGGSCTRQQGLVKYRGAPVVTLQR